MMLGKKIKADDVGFCAGLILFFFCHDIVILCCDIISLCHNIATSMFVVGSVVALSWPMSHIRWHNLESLSRQSFCLLP